MENLRARAQAAEEAAREAYVVETEAEDASRLADGAAKRLAVDSHGGTGGEDEASAALGSVVREARRALRDGRLAKGVRCARGRGDDED